MCIGRIGKDATVTSVNGRSVINFSLAHSEKYKDASGVQQEKTIWVECSYWVDRTGIAAYLKKGTMVYVEGQPEVKTYTRQDRSTGASLSVRVFSVQLLGSKQGEQSATVGGMPEPASSQSQQSQEQPIEDDLPF